MLANDDDVLRVVRATDDVPAHEPIDADFLAKWDERLEDTAPDANAKQAVFVVDKIVRAGFHAGSSHFSLQTTMVPGEGTM
jgi:hypothetical protein